MENSVKVFSAKCGEKSHGSNYQSTFRSCVDVSKLTVEFSWQCLSFKVLSLRLSRHNFGGTRDLACMLPKINLKIASTKLV